MRTSPDFRLLVAATFAALALVGCATQPATVEQASLRILLTNDDGYDAPGINAVRTALVEAGHDVILVAPLGDQSGSGTRVTTRGTLGYKERSNGTWSVDGSPADAVLVGLLHIMGDESPDLVVSGANFGPNLGYANSSGTVGAATMAMYLGLPAIAISVGIDPAELNAEPIPFASTFAAFAGAAHFTVKLIGDLHENRIDDGRLLPDGTILNVNYPATTPDRLAGVRVVQATWNPGVRIDYEQSGEAEELEVNLRLIDPATAGNDDVDWQWFARGYVTISVLDGNTDSGKSLRDATSRRLSLIGEQ